MEHRWNERVPCSMDVTLYRRNSPVATCKAINISMNGMFVLTGPIQYGRTTVLDVEFMVNHKKKIKRHRIPAYVIHKTRKGLGLIFREEDPKTISTLKKIMQRDPDINPEKIEKNISGDNILSFNKKY